MEIDHEHHRRTRRLLWTILVAATATSMAGNIAHALAHQSATSARGPILAAAIPPLALLSLTHLTGMWSRISVRGITYWCFLAAVACINAAAFRLSFDALRTLAVTYGYGPADAALFPLILDGLVGVCTIGLVVLARITGTGKSSDDAPMDPGNPRVDAPAESVIEQLDAPSDDGPRSGGGDAHQVSVSDADHLDLAQRLIAAGRTTADLDAVHLVLTRTAQGVSSRPLAVEAGLSYSAVQRIVRAAHQLRRGGADAENAAVHLG